MGYNINNAFLFVIPKWAFGTATVAFGVTNLDLWHEAHLIVKK